MVLLCANPYCYTNPCYNYEGKKPKFCSKHKKNGMVDVKSCRCIHPNCKKRSSYNIPTEKARYCSTHKTDEMINVKSTIKTCNFPGCKTCPCFNMPDKNCGLYCNEHKLEGMIHVLVKRCLHTNCQKRANFNFPDKKGLYCAEHKLEGMINVVEKTCIHPNCMKRPSYNVPNKKRLYCKEHKLEGMVNVVERPCITPLCSSFGFKKYEDHCLYCFVHLFPHSPHTRNYKTKEASVAEFVKTTFPQYTWIMDKRVQDGCSRRRPDLLLELGDQVLIVEVDENQHMDYDCSCENKRLMELSQDVGHRPLVFIRFNPDSYVAGGRKVPSCWHLNKDGLCVINHKPDWDIRLNALKQQIDYWIHERTTKTV